MPTPTATDAIGGRNRTANRSNPDSKHHDGVTTLTDAVWGAFPWGPYAGAIERWEAMTRPAPHPVDDKGRLDPPFVEWMMGFPAGWTEGMTRTQALKACGNAVVPQQAILALHLLNKEEPMTPKEGE